MRRIKIFTDRFPLLGPLVWVLSIEYFIVQIVAASAWKFPYSWRFNTISDLGNTICGNQSGRQVCSPMHSLMNGAFVLLGLIMAIGSLLIYQEFREHRATLVGFSMMALGGLGTILVGLFPENTVAALHITGAALPFVFGNLSLVVLGVSLFKIAPVFKTYTIISGLVPLIALVLLLSRHYFGLGVGGMERLVSYPQVIWLVIFGSYMSKSQYRTLKRLKARNSH